MERRVSVAASAAVALANEEDVGASIKDNSPLLSTPVLDVDLCEKISLKRAASTMETRSRGTRLRAIVGICLILALAGIIYFGYFCPDDVCALSNRDSKESTRHAEGLSYATVPQLFNSLVIK